METKKKARLTWRKQPNESGLARVGQGPRGAVLKVDGEDVGRVCANSVGFNEYRGWYWTAVDNAGRVPLKNTCDKPVAALDDAKRQCEAYVRKCIDNAGG